ncbi:Hypothetical predicted protein [Mytilus galloprovincialis]|uniref:Uncharacterized protein n=1 Tax=Mytilus galloprovincialis TaxID=29158 RepID=A0A8B6FZG1_MYTGA|nr:Hypothetical predicted protein [Mytilus galloprovincialis]
MTERSRSRHNERSSRIRASRNQHSPEGSRLIVCIEEEDSSSESEFHYRPTRDVSCQTRTKYVIQSQPQQQNHLRNEQPIGYVTKEESPERDYPQKYVIRRPPTRNVRCQMTTRYYIPAQYRKRKPSNKKIQVVLYLDTPSPRTPLSDNIKVTVHYDKDFDSLYPKLRKDSRKLVYYIDLRQPAHKLEQKPIEEFGHDIIYQRDTPSPRTPLSDDIEVTVHYDKDFDSLYPKSRKDSRKLVHYINLRQPANKLEQKPIEEFGRDIIHQLKKEGYIHDKVTDTRNNSIENPIVIVMEDGHIYDKVTDDSESITIKSTIGRQGQQSNYSDLSKEQKKNVINQTIVYDYR